MYDKKEIHEAINAADDALIALRNAEKSLSSAGSWGLWDMFGGGMFSTFLKHDKINRAQSELEEARNRLRTFRNELADLGRTVDFNLDIGGFLQFADYFFDDFFSDWMVQSKIRKGQDQVRKAIHEVENIRGKLWRMLG